MFLGKRPHSHVNTEGWMMSYADMITILLSMFIVLTTLGKDQTGANLQKGIDSFKEATSSLGLPGVFPTSSRAVPLDTHSPRYLATQPETPEDGPAGPRHIDGEQEQWQRFLTEMDRQFKVERPSRTQGQATVDLYDRLNSTPPYLAPRARSFVNQVLPILARPDYRVHVVVWATMPNDSAWIRASNQAKTLVEEIAAVGRLDAAARARLIPLGQPWLYPHFQRPIFSLVISKIDTDP